MRPGSKLLFFALLYCVACGWCDCATTTSGTNTDVVDVAIVLSVETPSLPLHKAMLPILLHFARRSNLGTNRNKTRIALLHGTPELDVKVKLEDGVSVDAINESLLTWHAGIPTKLALKDLGQQVRKKIFPQHAGTTTRPQIVVLFTASRRLQSLKQVYQSGKRSEEALADDGADIVAAVTRTAEMFDIDCVAKDQKIIKVDLASGRIAGTIHEMVRRLLKRCPFVKNVTDCFYNATRSCLAHVRYGGYPTGARYCLKQDPETIQCPVGDILPCEETCNRLSKWTKCNATQCEQAGAKRRVPLGGDNMTAHCPQMVIKCRGKRCNRKTKPGLADKVAGVVLLSLFLACLLIVEGGVIYYYRRKLKNARSRETWKSPQVSVRSTSSFSPLVNPPSLTATSADELVKRYAKGRDDSNSMKHKGKTGVSSKGAKQGSKSRKIRLKSVRMSTKKEGQAPAVNAPAPAKETTKAPATVALATTKEAVKAIAGKTTAEASAAKDTVPKATTAKAKASKK